MSRAGWFPRLLRGPCVRSHQTSRARRHGAAKHLSCADPDARRWVARCAPLITLDVKRQGCHLESDEAELSGQKDEADSEYVQGKRRR
jgi:hypothetical protein